MKIFFKPMPRLVLAAFLLLTACNPSETDRNTIASSQSPTGTPIPALVTESPVPVLSQPAGTPAAEPTFPPGETAGSQLPAGKYLAALDSETIPDLTPMFPGHLFTKTWKLRNAGTATWTTGYALVFVGGTQMNAAPEVYLPLPVPPGAQVDISVLMRAPYTVGVYQGFWKLRNEEGQLFGVGADGSGSIWVKVVCSSEPTRA